MPKTYYVAFWNVENLFDVNDSPRRSAKLERTLGKSIDGWNQQRLNKKITQLSSIIKKMNGGAGPDLLGVCEVENAHVLNLLAQAANAPNRNYAIQHFDTSDNRGIDSAFLYDANLFTPEGNFSHFVMRRTATREIFQVNFRTNKNRLLVVVGNHWPSRIPNKLETEGYRQIAGETLSYFHQRILEIHGKATPVLAMGDFNDEPFDRAIVHYARAGRSKTRVVKATTARFLNLMWPLMGQGKGTHYFNNDPNLLDQFLANKNLLKRNSPIQIAPASTEIVQFSEMTSRGAYPAPIRFGGLGKKVNEAGFSDHFPIGVRLTEAD